jgi:hypothetical protein
MSSSTSALLHSGLRQRCRALVPSMSEILRGSRVGAASSAGCSQRATGCWELQAEKSASHHITSQHITLQPSTSRHIKAQHSTAQHSTAPVGSCINLIHAQPKGLSTVIPCKHK